MPDTRKRCAVCKRWKKRDKFYRHNGRKDGLQTFCKACDYAMRDKRRKAFPRRERDTLLRSKFGISLDEYEAMLAEQGGVCAICGREPGRLRLAVDHDHATDSVRALLCGNCNRGIGFLDDSADLCRAAARYLDSHQGRKIKRVA